MAYILHYFSYLLICSSLLEGTEQLFELDRIDDAIDLRKHSVTEDFRSHLEQIDHIDFRLRSFRLQLNFDCDKKPHVKVFD